jgi:hypothetical protein
MRRNICYGHQRPQLRNRPSKPKTFVERRATRTGDGVFSLSPRPLLRLLGVQAFFREELEQCVDRVAALDADAEAYDAFVAQPMLPNNSLRGTIFDIHTVAAQLRRVLRDSQSYLMDSQRWEPSEPL